MKARAARRSSEAHGTNRASMSTASLCVPHRTFSPEADYAASAPSSTQLHVPEGFSIWACVRSPSTEVSKAAEEGEDGRCRTGANGGNNDEADAPNRVTSFISSSSTSEPLQVVDYDLTSPDVTPPPEADRAEFATSCRAFVEEDRSGTDRRLSGRCEEPNESDWEEDEETERESVRRYPSGTTGRVLFCYAFRTLQTQSMIMNETQALLQRNALS